MPSRVNPRSEMDFGRGRTSSAVELTDLPPYGVGNV